jgi:hypothetical protein
MITKQFEIEIGWGKIAGQLFSNSEDTSFSYPIIALHGFLDNSNSIILY